ncbi:MAG: phage tail tape measure protein [Peptostreptococcaceae bacterium]|nr:phage tail tape measure protein [Peptostreptococcaceae bacterium]
MAGNIKGITIEIGGSTTKLDKALKGVDSKARSMQTELKQINTLLKFDPKNTEALAQKQRVLAESLSNTREKLEILKEAQRQVAEQFARGDVSEEQYRRINREVEFTQQNVQRLEGQLRELNSTSGELTLEQDLKKADETAQGLQKELDEVNKLLKFDPKNTEALAQKQEILRESIENTKDKLELLREEQRRVAEQFERGEIGADQYREINREVVAAEQNLRSLQRELNNTNNTWGQAASSVEKFGKGAEKAGKAIMPLSAAAAGLGVGMVKTAADFEAGMSQVAATMGITAEEIRKGSEDFEKLSASAREMGKSTQFSAAQAAEALNYLALAGFDADKSVALLPKALDLAAAGGMELGQATDMITDSMSALGISVQDADRFIDEMARTSQKSNTSVAQLGDAILTVGATAKGLKGGTNELNTALGLLANIGVKGAEGGTKLRNIIMAMTPTTKAAAAAFEYLGVETYDAEGNLRGLNEIMGEMSEAMTSLTQEEKARIMSSIFNKQDLAGASGMLAQCAKDIDAVSSALELMGVNTKGIDLSDLASNMDTFADKTDFTNHVISNFGLDIEQASAMYEGLKNVISNTTVWDSLSENVRDSKDAAKEMADTMNDNLKGQLIELQSALSELAISLGNIMMPAIKAVVEGIQKFVDWLNNLSPAAQKTIVVILAIVAALGPLLILIGKISLRVADVMNFIGFIGPALAGLSGTATAAGGVLAAVFSPVGLAVAAVIAVIVLLIKNWDDLKYLAGELWNALTEIWNGIKETVVGAVTGIRDGIAGAWTGVKEAVTSKVSEIGEGLKASVDGWKEKFSKGWAEIKEGASRDWGAIKQTLSDRLGAIGKSFKDAGGGYRGMMAATWEAIKQTAALQWKGVKTVINTIAKALGMDLSGFWASIESKAKTAWENVKTAILRPIETARDKINQIVESIKGFFRNMKLEIPKIKMPKLPRFEMSGNFSLNPPQVPKIGVNWYKQGGIFSAPSIIGVGEAGREAVLPIDKIDSIMARAIEKVGGSGMSFSFAFNEPVTVRSEEDIERIADRAAQKIKQAIESRRRAGGRA